MKTVLDTFLAIARMVEASQQPQPSVENMTNDDIERTLTTEIETLIREHPKIAIAAADRLGWQLVPASK